MVEKKDDQLDRMDLAFRYYEEQWTHVRHHESQRSSLTLQIMVLAVSLGGGYFEALASSRPLRVGLSILIILLGVTGYRLVQSTQRATDSHIKRAREARESLGVLEPFAKAAYDFPRIHIYFLAFHALIVVGGLFLLIMTFF